MGLWELCCKILSFLLYLFIMLNLILFMLMILLFSICDWACKNRAYLHKLHMFRKWYFSWSLFMMFMCKFYLLSFWFMNKALRFYCHSICTSKDIVSLSSKIRLNFVCGYALFSQAWSHLQLNHYKQLLAI